MEIRRPYLLFLGDAPDQLAAKTAAGVAHWRRDWCLGQIRLPGCKADLGLDDLTLEQAAQRGARTLLVGVANRGGKFAPSWIETMIRGIELGMDVASGLHDRVTAIPAVAAAAEKHGRKLFDVRHPDRDFVVGNGVKRAGLRLLTVGTDVSCGKMFTALSIERELRARGVKADFRATGQTGIFIAGSGVSIDAVVSDFISGAVEWLSPDNDPDHWDLVEGQGSLFHPSYAGVTLGLIHGAQPDAMVLCHDVSRTHCRGAPHQRLPSLEDCLARNLTAAHLTNPKARFVGVSLNTSGVDAAEAERAIKSAADRLGLPATDPVKFGVAQIVGRLL